MAAIDAIIRDKWLDEKRYVELIVFILESWDSGNCDDFCEPVFDRLICERETLFYVQLWKGILRNRLEKLWRDYTFLKVNYPEFSLAHIKQTNISGYNQFSADEPIDREVAWRRNYILTGIGEFINGLETLGQNGEIAQMRELSGHVSELRKKEAIAIAKDFRFKKPK